MCGIAGVVTTEREPSVVVARLNRMVSAQVHRGPDDQGVCVSQVGDIQIGLGNTRLAILDLTADGHQPFASPCGRHVLVYNGEIYNYVELRAELASLGYRFRSRCDTEVLLYVLMHWGPDGLHRLNGMWALAWLDRVTGELVLARDRLGVKPLYYYRADHTILFASEIKAILTGSQRRFPVNTTAVLRFLEQSVRDAQPETFFGGINALPAGHIARIDLRARGPLRLDVRRYWDVAREPSVVLGEQEIIQTLRELFLDAVRLRLRSDVPVGVLLSGGLDSSSIAAAVRHVRGPGEVLHLFSAVSGDPRLDEQPFIDCMAAHLGQQAHEVLIRPSPRELLRLLHTTTYFNDEPLGGFSYVVHYLLMCRAKELNVTVLLNGQGGDELLCGYLKYLGFYLQHLVRTGRAPGAARVLAEFAWQRTVLPQVRLAHAKRYLPRALRGLRLEIGGPRLRGHAGLVDLGLGSGGVLGRQVEDLYRFSVPSLLHTEDRMSMAASREMRVPFLDYRLVSLLLPLAPELKLRGGWTKWALRKAMQPFLPPEITWRRDKRHFAVPEDLWLKNDLRPQVEEFMADDLLSVQFGLVDGQRLRAAYARYCREPVGGGWIAFEDVFNPLALEVWLREFQSFLAEPTEPSTLAEPTVVATRTEHLRISGATSTPSQAWMGHDASA
jgi:asparagine synthase (glutamine-hydrolysing)